SYDVITPSAARGILEAVFWKPAIEYVIDKIHVMNPIKFTNIRRNEVSSKVKTEGVLAAMREPEKAESVYLDTGSNIAQRSSMILQDVHYIVEAHFKLTDKAGMEDTEEKFYAMLCRRLRRGQCYHTPYFGCREFPVNFALYEEEELPSLLQTEERDLGLMLYDMDYTDTKNIVPTFFRAVLKDGTMDLQNCEVFR
ncbi:MAG: type I-C CRISPR-associated protein Cas5, partial [Clostridiales bacterium]|nr:type I-C CRISPR-associated protein Cas5 [Clostridiales bacterium]